jgi:hypothetical protein
MILPGRPEFSHSSTNLGGASDFMSHDFPIRNGRPEESTERPLFLGMSTMSTSSSNFYEGGMPELQLA